MAVRKSLVVAFGLLSGAAGCTHNLVAPPGATGPSVVAVPEGAVIQKEAEGPKRDPKAATCVAYGDFRTVESSAADQTPASRDSMREQARKAYLQALDIDPKNLKAYQSLAKLQVASGDHEQAIVTLKKGLQYHPKEAGLWYDLGMAHCRKKEWAPAMEALGKAAELNPQDRGYANMYGYCLARNGRFDESLACFSRINGEAKAHYNLARMLNHLDQRELSRTHLQLALQKDPTLEPAKQLLAQFDGKVPEVAAAPRPEPSVIQQVGYFPTPQAAHGPASAVSPLAVSKHPRPVPLPTEENAGSTSNGILLPHPPMSFARGPRSKPVANEAKAKATPVGLPFSME